MLALLTFIAALQASPAAAPSAVPAPTAAASPAASAEDPATTKIAVRELAAWQAGKPDWSHYVQSIPNATVQQVQSFLGGLGSITGPTFLKRVQPPGAPFALSVYSLKGTNASALMLLHVSDAGKIDLIYFRPAQ